MVIDPLRGAIVYVDTDGNNEAWNAYGERIECDRDFSEFAKLPLGFTLCRRDFEREDQSMKFKKRPRKGQCFVMRCGADSIGATDPTDDYPKGIELCEKHAKLAESGEIDPPPATATAPAPAAAPATAPAPEMPTAIAISTEPAKAPIEAIVAPVKAEAEANAIRLANFRIVNQQQLDLAGEFLKKIKADAQGLEATRKSVTKPMLDAKKQIDNWFRPARVALEKCEAQIKQAISTFVREQETAKLAALQSGNTAGALALPTPELPQGVTARPVWRYEIVDASAIPREFLTADHIKIAAAVTAYKDATNIPGIRVYLDQTIAARTS